MKVCFIGDSNNNVVFIASIPAIVFIIAVTIILIIAVVALYRHLQKNKPNALDKSSSVI